MNLKIKICISFLGLTFSCVLAALFALLGLDEVNIVLAFILGVQLIAFFTEGYVTGIISSVLSVLLFNYFFTAPIYTLQVYEAKYIFTFIVMFFVSILTSSLTSRIKKQYESAEKSKESSDQLSMLSRELIKATRLEEIYETASRHLKNIVQLEVTFIHVETEKESNKIVKWICDHKMPAGKGTNYFNSESSMYMPIIVSGHVHTIMVILDLREGLDLLSDHNMKLINSTIALALDRDVIQKQQELYKFETEHQKLINNMLSSMSHDIRTPLTGIIGSANTILLNPNEMDQITRESLIRNISEDAEWLLKLIENMLSITKLKDGKLIVNKTPEVLEEIINEAVHKAYRIDPSRQIQLNVLNSLIVVHVDGNLIVQLVYNLLENAIKYTPSEAKININMTLNEQYVNIEVEDFGDGIDETMIASVFERFFTAHKPVENIRNSMGLGLAICKSIAELHDGLLSVKNNAHGGATFILSLPYNKEDIFI